MLQWGVRDHGVEARGFRNVVADYSCHIIVYDTGRSSEALDKSKEVD